MNSFLKTFVSLTVVVVLLCAFAGPAFAEPAAPGAENELTAIYSQDFEAFDASASADEIFSDPKGNKPAGMNEFIGDGENSGAIISAGKVGGTKSLRLMRIDGGVANIRVNGLSTRTLGNGSKLYYSFSFRYAVLGNYGFTSVLAGINASPSLEDYGGETRNIFAVKTDMNTGKDSIFVVNPDGTAERILVYDGLKAETDYKLTAAFTIGSDEYEVLLNGESLGKFKYIGEMTSVTGLRIDCHDWAYECDVSRAQAGDVHVNEVYFDDISLTAVPEGAPVEDQDKTYKFVEYEEFFVEDWEDTEETDEYAKPAEETPPFTYIGGMPFIKAFKTPFINPLSSVRVFGGSDAIDSVTLGLKDFADMRFWSIVYPLEEDDAIYAAVDLNVKALTGYFDMCVTNSTGDGGATASTAQGGAVFRIIRSSTGKLEVIGSNSQVIAELEDGKTYNIGVVLTIATNKFLTYSNLMSVLKQTTFTALLSTGMLLCLITAGIDLSVGANATFCACMCGMMVKGGMTNPVVLILVALIAGTIIGLINGTLLTRLRHTADQTAPAPPLRIHPWYEELPLGRIPPGHRLPDDLRFPGRLHGTWFRDCRRLPDQLHRCCHHLHPDAHPADPHSTRTFHLLRRRQHGSDPSVRYRRSERPDLLLRSVRFHGSDRRYRLRRPFRHLQRRERDPALRH